jgi:hypothetical protein
MKKIFTLIVMLAATLGMQAQDTWTIVGVKALCGTNWDPTDTANDMTGNNNVFTLVRENVMLKAGEYEYKVAKNHAWDESYGSGEGNAKLVIDENAAYKVTFTFTYDTENNSDSELIAEATKTGEYVKPDTGDQTWTVAGVPELCGASWDPAATENDMNSEDNVIFKWTKTNVPLDKDTPYGFKVCANHEWAEAYGGAAGGQTSDNYEIMVTVPGLYTVEITFNSEEQTIAVATTKTGDYEFGEKTWTICGVEALCGVSWDPTATENDMIKTAEGEYTLVKKNVALLPMTEYEYKVAANHAWTESYGMDGGSNNQVFQLDIEQEEGLYDITFIFLTETKTLEAFAEPSDPAGVSTLKAMNSKNTVIYNLAGQRVNNNFRGIAIENSKKIVVK